MCLPCWAQQISGSDSSRTNTSHRHLSAVHLVDANTLLGLLLVHSSSEWVCDPYPLMEASMLVPTLR